MKEGVREGGGGGGEGKIERGGKGRNSKMEEREGGERLGEPFGVQPLHSNLKCLALCGVL